MLPDELTGPGQGVPAREHAVRAEEDLLTARHAVRASAVAAGFTIVDQTKIVTAASELVRNAYIHGGGGTMTIAVARDGRGRAGLRLTVRDEGPGIADVEQAMTDGFSTGAGLGHGLGGTRRLVDEFTIDTAPGHGTTVTIVRWKP
ncbi:ATP-binding protein [Amycolatopsis sp. WAC 01376]|uniref:ATP-binding protein n=1 Tax=Amycolatopsis sp. WAC 01376 TaxID=2203195 RepID=UPI000F79B337|nr:ATP-binding protein [Amycolatopsis sp. WAC 01376]RSM57177.1 ATP-binding protein [Amycolatopsis sp. WAC 01376]